jgi:hypothetical protein
MPSTPSPSRAPRVHPLIACTVVLADQLDPRAGHAEVTMPWVVDGNYSVNVWGDSGNVGVRLLLLAVSALSHMSAQSFFQILGGFDPNVE